VIQKEGRKYKFVGCRTTSLHGLFGMIEYKRAVYFSEQEIAQVFEHLYLYRKTEK